MYLLGVDVGSSSVKASLVSIETGKSVAGVFYPKSEAPIQAVKVGWAEQDPQAWWGYLKDSVSAVMREAGATADSVKAIGISYQMHGLVCVDKNQQVLRPAIIWCDSRAVKIGDQAFQELGHEKCLTHLLNSPGNFTLSKLRWVQQNEPALYERIDKVLLPGDYIGMRMTGEARTTISGLSEGIAWDFQEGKMAQFLLDYYGIDRSLLPTLCPTFGEQGRLTEAAAKELGLAPGTPVTYRAGDQPNNALSLNVFEPGEVAATAGTSGVVYGVNGRINYDKASRVNSFAHVNHTDKLTRLGILLCVNGTGILNSWLKRNIMPEGLNYPAMNDLASQAPIGAEGLSIFPFGNGAERMLRSREVGCQMLGVNFNVHGRQHIARAAQEGIVFSLRYGMEIMELMGVQVSKIHAGNANMFLSPLFRQTLANISGAVIELYDTDGSVGAAKGAGMGAGIYKDHNEAFSTLNKVGEVEPNRDEEAATFAAYSTWRDRLGYAMR